MAIEQIRGCGWRKVEAMYLCGEYIHAPCDRMPLPLTTCPVCGQGIKVSRGFTRINPLDLWGPHDKCTDRMRPCHLCDPQNQPAYIMLVGKKSYTPDEFLVEAQRMGVSKRIPFIPKELELGKTVIYLAHPKAVEVREPLAIQQAMAIAKNRSSLQPSLFPEEMVKPTYQMGIFCAFIPKRVEKLIWQSEATPEELEKLQKRGITPIIVTDGDKNHV